MIIIHFDSGLGNQMLTYCEYLALKSVNPTEDFYIETITYDIPECNAVISQWYGYELEKIFGLSTPPNVKTLFSDKQWVAIMEEVRNSRFWEKNWNYPLAITKALNHQGLHLENVRGDFSTSEDRTCADDNSLRARFRASYLGDVIRRYLEKKNEQVQISSFENKANLFLKVDRDIFTGPWLSFYRKGNNRESIDAQIRQAYRFPMFDNERDMKMAGLLDGCNSVAIHVRRGDALYSNAWCYKYGYFKRSVQFIRKNVDKPVFVFFTEPSSVEWCKENEVIFGIDSSRDIVYFVDWHRGEDSFRDMQLMAHCKHAIITTSSFGWFGAYFIENPDKITISAYRTIDTTHHF